MQKRGGQWKTEVSWGLAYKPVSDGFSVEGSIGFARGPLRLAATAALQFRGKVTKTWDCMSLSSVTNDYQEKTFTLGLAAQKYAVLRGIPFLGGLQLKLEYQWSHKTETTKFLGMIQWRRVTTEETKWSAALSPLLLGYEL